MSQPKEDGKPNSGKPYRFLSDTRIKELLGLPTYIAGILALMKASNNGNTLLVIISVIPFVIAYYYFYDYLFPDKRLHWSKVMLLIGTQAVFWALVWKYLV